ncbi:MAG: hypothetical protein ACFFCG_10700, partial [Promethearchaeota archaeon]
MVKISKRIPIISLFIVLSFFFNLISISLSSSDFYVYEDLRREELIQKNEPNASQIQIKNQTIKVDETWSGNILVTRSITVSKGATLTILPGTVVKFKHYRGYKTPDARLSLFVAGTIKALGGPNQQ